MSTNILDCSEMCAKVSDEEDWLFSKWLESRCQVPKICSCNQVTVNEKCFCQWKVNSDAFKQYFVSEENIWQTCKQTNE